MDIQLSKKHSHALSVNPKYTIEFTGKTRLGKTETVRIVTDFLDEVEALSEHYQKKLPSEKQSIITVKDNLPNVTDEKIKHFADKNFPTRSIKDNLSDEKEALIEEIIQQAIGQTSDNRSSPLNNETLNREIQKFIQNKNTSPLLPDSYCFETPKYFIIITIQNNFELPTTFTLNLDLIEEVNFYKNLLKKAFPQDEVSVLDNLPNTSDEQIQSLANQGFQLRSIKNSIIHYSQMSPELLKQEISESSYISQYKFLGMPLEVDSTEKSLVSCVIILLAFLNQIGINQGYKQTTCTPNFQEATLVGRLSDLLSAYNQHIGSKPELKDSLKRMTPEDSLEDRVCSLIAPIYELFKLNHSINTPLQSITQTEDLRERNTQTKSPKTVDRHILDQAFESTKKEDDTEGLEDFSEEELAMLNFALEESKKRTITEANNQEKALSTDEREKFEQAMLDLAIEESLKISNQVPASNNQSPSINKNIMIAHPLNESTSSMGDDGSEFFKEENDLD